MDKLLPYLETLIHGLGKHFGDSVEFVVHDYNQDFSRTIIAIANGGVTKRKVGENGTSVGLKIMQGYEEEDGKYCYITQTKDGKYLKSSTIYIKDEQCKIIGSLCVNCDITDAMVAQNFLNQYVGNGDQRQVEATVYNNIDDLLVALINESIQYVGVPVAHMNRDQKIKGIRFLEQKGALKIKNASTIIAKYYDVSKYTVYNYIDESHNVEINER